MIESILHIILSAGVLLLSARLVPGLKIEGFGYAVVGALVLGLINAVIRPLMVILTLPLTIVTLGLFLLVINALLLMLAAAIAPGFSVRGFGSAFVASLLVSLFNLILSLLFGF